MRRVLAGERGDELSAERQGMIESVFADTKSNRRCDGFQRPADLPPGRNGA